MYNRPEDLANFIGIAQRLFQSPRLPDAAREVAAKVFDRLERPASDGMRAAKRHPACDLLDAALAPLLDDASDLGAAARTIKTLEPSLGWQRRTSGLNGSENYVDRHVHGMICGPGGMESRYDVQLGFSLLAPFTRYPDHQHLPEEAYVLLSAGEFRQRDGDWFDPGIGGGLHNTPDIVHAMRSGSAPLLAMWCLLS
ncbi:dimethylsulfonioproprionate lyase family protein [Burkholderia catarinensis]|uniref:dimethylsulfonioproprionate lyase family protein n=1 Tax=Burkholderia catarinensis TaxID=1108140 RepID=UPI000921083E|nr:dimethylsulfonioproprionate lyase family protein [Burkholderia catarinensis]KAG8152381.1 transcriptional regulator [Burkholderia catarinensis]